MKAIQITEPGCVRLAEMPCPAIKKPDEVLIKIRYVGICGSDVHIYHGSNPFASYPRIFGHEFVGEVTGVGTGVTSVHPGDHVLCEPIEYCGHCYACRTGSPNVCPDVKVYGVHIDGGAQEYICMPERKVFAVDKELPWEEVALAEPLTIGAQVCMRGGVKVGDTVFIMGAGTIGLCILMIAKRLGAECIISDIVPKKLEYAKRLGADHVIDVRTESAQERLNEITAGYGPNVTVDTVCNTASLELAAEVTSPAGRVVELGFGSMQAAIPLVSFTKKQLAICGSRLQSGQFPRVAQLLNEQALPLGGFADKVFPAEQAVEAFAYADANAGKYRKILLAF